MRCFPRRATSLVGLHAGVGDPWRQWPPENFAAVGDALAQAGACVLLTGLGFEEPITRAVAEKMTSPAVDLSGRLSIGGLAALLSRCKVVVSNDSGPLHIAAAVGAATVGIYWAGNLINAGSLLRARHRPHLSWRMECPDVRPQHDLRPVRAPPVVRGSGAARRGHRLRAGAFARLMERGASSVYQINLK